MQHRWRISIKKIPKVDLKSYSAGRYRGWVKVDTGSGLKKTQVVNFKKNSGGGLKKIQVGIKKDTGDG
jgi:hypothetical protein